MKQFARRAVMLAACFFSLFSFPEPASPREVVPESPLPAQAVAGEVIVKFSQNASPEQRMGVVDVAEGAVVEQLASSTVKVDLGEGVDAGEAARSYEDQPAVEYAEPNYLVRIAGASDPLRSQQWALTTTGIDAAWSITTGRPDVMVAVIDTGIDLEHPDLSGQVSGGYDFVNEDADPTDDHGHGTLVAGSIAAKANNGAGIAGTAPGVRLLALKALSATGIGNDFDVARAIRYAADRGAKVINMSFGGPDASQTLQDAIDYAYAKGVVLVGAAGNEGQGSLYYPGAGAHVMAVGASDRLDRRASFSNYGRSLSVIAPGVSVLSTSRGGRYDPVSGTSIAAPQVAGVAALIFSNWPSLRPDDVRARIERSAKDGGTPGYDEQYGWGRLDAAAAMAAPEEPSEASQTPPQSQPDNAALPAENTEDPPGQAPAVTNSYVYPNPFSPNGDGYLDATSICWNLSADARVSVILVGAGKIKRTLLRLVERPAGSNCLGWTGTDDRGLVLPDGNYNYRITATNSSGTSATVTGIAALDRDAYPYAEGLPEISEASFSPNPFFIRSRRAQSVVSVAFAISRDAYVNLKIFDARGEVKGLVTRQVKMAGTYRLGWTGTDNAGKLLPPGNYRYVVYAANTHGTRTYSGVVGIR